jgi:tRNA dimethylallyltransferase
MSKDIVKKPKLLVIVGPNAVGKSDLAVKLAKKCDGEVISADSRQVYRDLNIGSGKITKEEMQGVPHHLLDVADPKDTFTVADFKKLGEKDIANIVGRKKLPIIVGGTGFYIQALVDNIALPEVPPNEKLREILKDQSTEELYSELIKRDPKRSRTIDKSNKRRLIRAIEIAHATGTVPPPSKECCKYNTLFIGLDVSDEALKRKIHIRLFARIMGIVTEVDRLHDTKLTWKRLEELGLEYRYTAEYLQGKISEKEMTDKIEMESWHYAKRQRTWFKRDKRIKWFDPQNLSEIFRTVNAFLKKD